MDKKELRDKARVEAVLELIKKQAPLTVKQEKFCNNACVQRFLKAKGDNVKRAAKQLRACLSWRENIGTEHMVADEFSGELADGLAYVAGHDHESRPVMIIRMKQDYQKFHCQKMFTRLLVFTLEVAVSTMPKNVQQFVILFDASFYRSASGFLNLLLGALKIAGEYYPGRLHRAFIIDPPSLFPYLWKGVGAFVELSGVTTMVSSVDIMENDESADLEERRRIKSCASSRFAFTVSHHVDSLKPWYLSLTDTTPPPPVVVVPQQRTPRPSFFQSPAGSLLFRRGESSKCRESFLPYWKIYRRPYDEMVYRSKMKAPLCSSQSRNHIRRRHLSLSQRF